MGKKQRQTVEEFLASGGKIQQCERGETGLDPVTGLSKRRMEQLRSKYPKDKLFKAVRREKHFGVALE